MTILEQLINETSVIVPSLAQIHQLVELIPFATIVIDDKGEIVVVSQLVETLFGYHPHQLIGRPIDSLLPERFRSRHVQHRAGYMADPVTRPMNDRRELIALCEDGREFPAEITLRPLDTQDGRLVLATIRDITRRKRKEEKLRRSRQQLRELSARLIAVSEAERARLARTFHDELGQLMTGFKMDLAWLNRHLHPDQQPLIEKTQVMSDLIDASIQSIRQISTELRPGILDDFGLEAAVEWQLEEFQQRTGIPCTLISDMNECAPNANKANAAFCILKESLTNIARHAGADQVDVALTGDTTLLTLVIRDDGRGITEEEIHHPSSIGLLGMRERAHMRGAKVQIEGAAGRGSAVTLRMPLTSGEENEDD